MSDVYVDGVPASVYLQQVVARHRAGAQGSDDMFWASNEAGPVTQTATQEVGSREVLQVEFSGYRMVNHLSFLVSRFPHVVRGEYWDPQTSDWLPLKAQTGEITPVDPAFSIAEQRAKWEGSPVSHRVTDSYPVRINPTSASNLGVTHPQHFGSKHWVPVTWRTVPVYTRAVRLILVRTMGAWPVGPGNKFIPYSLAVKDLQVGYRVYGKNDIPDAFRASLTDFATSADLLGERLAYRLKTYPANAVVSDADNAHWRSEPQPVNYAVVNLYVDVRDAAGQGQVIDRFYIDPLTVGPVMNLYWTNDDPDADFEADDSPLTYPVGRVMGTNPVVETNPETGEQVAINFSGTSAGNFQFDNGHLQWNPSRGWWLGVTLRLDTETGTHPIFAWAGHTLRQVGRSVQFVTADGQNISVAMPAHIFNGSDVNIALVFNPDRPGVVSPDEAQGGFWLQESTVTLAVGNAGGHNLTTLQVSPTALSERPSTLYVGTYSTAGTFVSDITLRGLFLKVDDVPERGYVEGFIDDPSLFYLKTSATSLDLTRNALLRIHPSFWTPEIPTGAVGGPGDRYEDAVWTPVPRDYTLRQGFVRFPPVRAKHFKFEFTNLVHMNFDNLVPIRRKVRLFPPGLVERYQRLMRGDVASEYHAGIGWGSPTFDYTKSAPGVQTMMDMVAVGNYNSAIVRLREIAQNNVRQPSRTEAYVAKDPLTAKELADLGWVWSFAPWHIASSAPRWERAAKHAYEYVSVEHDTKVGFFVGIKYLRAHRVDYLSDDDTEQYIETFSDTAHLGAMEGVEVTSSGVTSISHQASVTSKVLPSTRNVRGVQFASIQSDNIALLPDDGFVEEDLSLNWAAYGDASIQRQVGQGVLVSRGALPDTTGGGGMVSGAVYASPAGRVYAAVRVTPVTAPRGPVRLEIVSMDTGTVLAAEERILAPDEEAVITVGYEVGTAVDILTYGDLEAYTYGQLEQGTVVDGVHRAGTYGDLQSDPIGGPVFARFRQMGPSNDRFLVERLSLFDAPISWEFSVDGGATWYDGLSIRNNPQGVLTFPEPGKELVWRASIFHRDAEVSALAVRPWYGGLVGSVGRSAEDFVGPNRSVIDDYPDTSEDPMWTQSHDPVPGWWYHRDVANQFSGAPNILVDGEVVMP